MRDFIITTDSNSDLPEAYINENNIKLISHYYEIDGKLYGEDNLLPANEFYDKMRAGSMPVTMASNPAVIREVFTNLVSEGYDVLHISFSSALSGGFSNVTIGGREIVEKYPEAKIVVYDSLNVSMGQGLMIMKAIDMKKEGKSIDQIVAWLDEHRMNFSVQFTVDDLFHLHRGGRVSRATAIVGTLINVKPILYVNTEGALVSLSNVRGRKKALSTIVDNMIERMGSYKTNNYYIGVLHADSPKEADFVADLIREKLGTDKLIINTVSPSIGAHSGPGTVGVCFMADER